MTIIYLSLTLLNNREIRTLLTENSTENISLNLFFYYFILKTKIGHVPGVNVYHLGM